MKILRTYAFVLAALACPLAGRGETNTHSPLEIFQMTREAAEKCGETFVRGVVVHASSFDRPWFALADVNHIQMSGVVVRCPDGMDLPPAGAVVKASGRIVKDSPAPPEFIADHFDVIRSVKLPPPPGVKQSDFRRGILVNRRADIHGIVTDIDVDTADTDAFVTTIGVYLDSYTAYARIPGSVDPEELMRKHVHLTGFIRNRYGKNGVFLESVLEMSDPDDIEITDDESGAEIILASSVVAGFIALFFLAVFVALWLREYRERRDLAVIVAERRRMAADLHDTIEQHLAGANLIAAGVRALKDVPPEVVEAMDALGGILTNAKAEVRSAVMKLRTAGAEFSLLGGIAAAAASLEKTGVRTRRLLRGLPPRLPSDAGEDILLIVREAVTNAVKHGKAKRVVFTSDPLEDGGFVLRILNDGAAFEPSAALGPDTGHYGLVGMRERALRHNAEILWGRHGRWTFVEIKAGGNLI